MENNTERRSSERRGMDSRVLMTHEAFKIYGWIHNISRDGALVRIDGATGFGADQLGCRIEIESLPESALKNLPAAGKLVRVFDLENDRFLALRFLDYLAEET